MFDKCEICKKQIWWWQSSYITERVESKRTKEYKGKSFEYIGDVIDKKCHIKCLDKLPDWTDNKTKDSGSTFGY